MAIFHLLDVPRHRRVGHGAASCPRPRGWPAARRWRYGPESSSPAAGPATSSDRLRPHAPPPGPCHRPAAGSCGPAPVPARCLRGPAPRAAAHTIAPRTDTVASWEDAMPRRCLLVALIAALALVPAGASAQDARDDFHHLGSDQQGLDRDADRGRAGARAARGDDSRGHRAGGCGAGRTGIAAGRPTTSSSRSGWSRWPAAMRHACTPDGAGRTSARRSGGSRCGRRCSRPTSPLLAPRDRAAGAWPGSTRARSFPATRMACRPNPPPSPTTCWRSPQRSRKGCAAASRKPTRGSTGVPLGAAALGTSGFPIDRERLAALLGFDGVLENSYDANHVSSVDSKTELASALAISAIAVGQFSEDVQVQYHDPAPWLLLDRSLTGISSIMPQKRNPIALERLRQIASTVLGDAQTVFLTAHNTSTGMIDYRGADQILETAAEGPRDVRAVRGRRRRPGGRPRNGRWPRWTRTTPP